MLADRGRCRRHARALRSVLHASSLRLVLHAPDDLSFGTSEHDRAFDGMLEYASEVGAEIIAYHGLNFADAEGPARARIRERAQLEERSLRGLLQRAHTLGVTVAVENLAPVHPAPPRLCHDALAWRRRSHPTSCSSPCTTTAACAATSSTRPGSTAQAAARPPGAASARRPALRRRRAR
jgi:sugar phosphate isomerase/epimerase